MPRISGTLPLLGKELAAASNERSSLAAVDPPLRPLFRAPAQHHHDDADHDDGDDGDDDDDDADDDADHDDDHDDGD